MNPYGEIRFEGSPVPSLKFMDTEGKIVYLGSFSKVLAPGLRLAWICATSEIIRQAELIKEGWDLQCNQFCQVQAVEYIQSFDFEAHIKKIQQRYKSKCNLMLEQMSKEFPENVSFTRPEGGMFIWVTLPEHLDAGTFLDIALEKGIAYVPGEFFYADEGPKNTLRMNFTTVSEEKIVEGIKLLGQALHGVC